MWSAFFDVAARENRSINDICTDIASEKKPETSLTAAIRVFLLAYFRAAATEDGHVDAGHGTRRDWVLRHQPRVIHARA